MLGTWSDSHSGSFSTSSKGRGLRAVGGAMARMSLLKELLSLPGFTDPEGIIATIILVVFVGLSFATLSFGEFLKVWAR
jgi:hypothetical protein